MGNPMRLELTLAGLLVKLANHYTTRGAQTIQRIKNPNFSYYNFFFLVYIQDSILEKLPISIDIL